MATVNIKQVTDAISAALKPVQDAVTALRTDVAALQYGAATTTMTLDALHTDVAALESVVYVVTDPEPKPEPTDDWATRSAGRVMARLLRDPGPAGANIAGRWPSPDGGILTDDPTYTKPVVDERGVRFDIESDKGIQDVYYPLPQEFGANTFFAMQVLYRMNQAFRDTTFLQENGAPPGIKIAVLSVIEGSSTSGKFVIGMRDQHKFLNGYRYNDSGVTDALEVAINNGADFDLQPKVGVAPTCLRSVIQAAEWADPNTPNWGGTMAGCVTIPGETDVYIDVEAETGGLIPGTNTWDCDIRIWMTIPGSAPILAWHYGPGIPGYRGRNAVPWKCVWLTPYMTNRATQQFPVTPSVWYDELIVDNKRINAALTDPGHQSQPNPEPEPEPEPEPGDLPSWVPAPGSFAAFTLNKPQDVGMGAGTLANWCGGAFIADFGASGGVAYHGGREHGSGPITNGQQAVYVLDCAARSYVRRCYPTQINAQASETNGVYSGTPTDDWGELTDGSCGTMHTYNGLCDFPAAWGGGPSGSLARVGQSAGTSKTKVDAGLTGGSSESNAATWRFDLSKNAHTLADRAMTRITGTQAYKLDPAFPNDISVVSDAPVACIDTTREGWWNFARTDSGTRGLSFTSKNGVVTNFARPGLALSWWSKMHHMADDDILCVICDQTGAGVSQFGHVRLLNLADPNSSWVAIDPTRDTSDPAMDWSNPLGLSAGYGGPQWSTILNAFVMLDANFSPAGQVRAWKLTPPPPGQRFTGTWTWTVETLTSADGSIISRSDSSLQNGAWGKLVECPALRSFVWTRGLDKPGQLIRLRGMG